MDSSAISNLFTLKRQTHSDVLRNKLKKYDNVYHLLSNEHILHVAALNSSVLYEAKYFRKEVTFLYKPTFDFENGDIGIYGDYWSSAFWVYNEISDEIVVKDIIESKIKYLLSKYIKQW